MRWSTSKYCNNVRTLCKKSNCINTISIGCVWCFKSNSPFSSHITIIKCYKRLSLNTSPYNCIWSLRSELHRFEIYWFIWSNFGCDNFRERWARCATHWTGSCSILAIKKIKKIVLYSDKVWRVRFTNLWKLAEMSLTKLDEEKRRRIYRKFKEE